MIFDKLCRFAEHAMPAKLIPILKDAAHNFLPQLLTPEQKYHYENNFFLPFHIVAVEDTASCILVNNPFD